MLALEHLTSPQDLLLALEAQAGRRLPLALGREANDVTAHDPLLRHWLLPGGVVELSTLPGALALSLAFALARGAREQALVTGRPRWIGAVDGAGTLCAPALAHVLDGPITVPRPLLATTAPASDQNLPSHLPGAMQETLVVRPGIDADAIMGCALRLVRSGTCCAVVVDATGLFDLSGLMLHTRRLVLAAEQSGCAVTLVTSQRARRGLTLPVAARALVDVNVDGDVGTDDGHAGGLVLRPLRHRHGLPPRLVVPRRRLAASLVDTLLDEVWAEAAPAPATTTLSLVSAPATTTTTTTTTPTLSLVPAQPSAAATTTTTPRLLWPA